MFFKATLTSEEMTSLKKNSQFRGIGHFKMATVDRLSGISKTYVLKFKGDLKTILVPF